MSIWTWLKPLGVTNGSSLRESSTGGRISAVPSYLKSIARAETGAACAVVNGWTGSLCAALEVSEATATAETVFRYASAERRKSGAVYWNLAKPTVQDYIRIRGARVHNLKDIS